APEQFQGRALPASDVYAIGATVLALVTGQDPENLPHRGLAIDVHAALDGAAPAWLERALTAMLEPDPDRRPSRILPLLGGPSEPPPRAPGSPGAQALRESVRQYAQEQVDRALDQASRTVSDARGVRRDARRDAREHRRERRRAQRGRRPGAPFPIAAFLMVG